MTGILRELHIIASIILSVLAMSLLMPSSAYAEKSRAWESFLQEMFENSDEGAEGFEAAYDYLTELQTSPLDINTAEVAELLLIPGLDQNIINDIIEYREKYGDMKSITELTLIPSIDNRLRDYLSCFLYAGEKEYEPWYSKGQLRQSLNHIRHTVLATMSTPTYYRAGDRALSTATGNKYAGAYLGDPVRHSVRYQAKIGSHIAFNLTGGKNAGEPFGCYGNGMGYDTYSYNISIKKLGRFRNIIAGHFRTQFGMGLTMNTGFTLGKQAMLQSTGRLTNTFTPHSSASDGKHFQGIATCIDLPLRTQLSAFASCLYVDATLNRDSSSVSSFIYSPQHRTHTEMAKKHNTMKTDFGLHLRHTAPLKDEVRWSIGASFTYSAFNRTLNPTFSLTDTISSSRLYRLHHPHGSRFWNAGADYSLRWRTVTLCGETAVNDKGAIATINTASWRTSQHLTLSAIQRYYPYQYYSINGSCFSSGSNLQNESGLYVAAQYRLPGVTIDAYTDVAYYPWPKYRISGSSYSWDNCISTTYSHKEWTLTLRYRANSRQRDITTGNTKQMIWRTDQRLRLTATYQTDPLTLRIQAEGCHLAFDNTSNGIMTSVQADYTPGNIWRIYATGAYFNTEDYDSRLYTYERGMLNSFGFSSYYGKGIRFAVMLRADFSEHIMAMVKAGHTHYFDRDSIGTAERTIYSHHQTDIDLQVRLKF